MTKLSFLARFGALFCVFGTVTACSGSGGGSNAAAVPAPVVTNPAAPTQTPSPKGGVTVAQRMGQGQIIVGHSVNAVAVESPNGNIPWKASQLEAFQIRNNFVGGVDVSINGKIFYLKTADQQNDGTSWSQSSGGATPTVLALWNAGKGNREGLTSNQEGQFYHKIVGFHLIEPSGKNTRGHVIVGEQTPVANLSAIERKATYNGYYVTNAYGADPAVTGTTSIKGGLQITADFDAGTVQGTATEVLVEAPGSLGPINFGNTMSFNGTMTGARYTGTMTSSQRNLSNATVNGAFYGAGAEETAGTIANTQAEAVTEGFFTASQ